MATKATERRKNKKALELLVKLGLDKNPEVQGIFARESGQPSAQYSKTESVANIEGVLRSLQRPSRIGVSRICKDCGEPFVTNYEFVAYCGDLCRASALKKVGLTVWKNSFTDEEKWGGVPPSLIPPDALKAMKAIIVQVERETGRPVEMPLSPASSEPDVSSPNSVDIECPPHSEEHYQDKIPEVLSEPIVQESEDDLLDILNALDG